MLTTETVQQDKKTGSPADSNPTWWQLVAFFTPLILAFIAGWFALQSKVALMESRQIEQGLQIQQMVSDNKQRDQSQNAVLQRLERIESKQDSGNERLRELLSRK